MHVVHAQVEIVRVRRGVRYEIVARSVFLGGRGAVGFRFPSAINSSNVTMRHPPAVLGSAAGAPPPGSLPHPNIVGKHAAETHTAASSAWLQMKRTASGPNVSYNGTETKETRVMADSRTHHSAQFMLYRPTFCSGRTPRCTNPDDAAARCSYTEPYVCHVYAPGTPSASIDRVPKHGRSLWRLHVLSHTS
eukprot:30497-Pelagococcus_subviridis.AAC.4